MNKTKIVATIGPASSSPEVLEAMLEAGVNVCRINFSHSTHDDVRRIVKTIRGLNNTLGKSAAILTDLQGPKIRLGEVPPGVVLEDGAAFKINTRDEAGSQTCASIGYPDFAKDVSPGDRLMIDDGKLELEVQETDGNEAVTTRVVRGGPLSSRKGVNLPDTPVSIPAMTEKDFSDVEVALEVGAEWIGLSFVRAAGDVAELQRLIQERDGEAKVIAKIEKPEAIDDIEAIVIVADALMVARGDLGVEIPMERVPVVQKMIINRARQAAKPVVIATQMMESMIDATRPTRAEVSDVSNSVLDGAAAVMLSAETSVGKHPVQVVEAMRTIVTHAESHGYAAELNMPPSINHERFVSDAICYNACRIGEQLGAKAIMAMSSSGYAAFRLASHRPHCNIFVFTSNPVVLRMLSLVWGVQAFHYDAFVSTDDTFRDIQGQLKEKGLLEPGELVIHTASMPIGDKGQTNALKISYVDS